MGSCHLLEDFQLKQKDLWRILTHIHSTSHTYSPHSDKQQTTEITNSNPVNITQRISENEQKKSDVTPSKSKQGLISVPKANSATKVAAGEDISSSADIQTLLLQQKVYFIASILHPVHVYYTILYYSTLKSWTVLYLFHCVVPAWFLCDSCVWYL